eukprot:GHVU01171022.1.p1 GENE.GHVU01171022.1~~GHVU01171022.1.p1  ORF type:complete len:125 (-),score=1.85 GHVU01171022.1:138-512(-)
MFKVLLWSADERVVVFVYHFSIFNADLVDLVIEFPNGEQVDVQNVPVGTTGKIEHHEEDLLRKRLSKLEQHNLTQMRNLTGREPDLYFKRKNGYSLLEYSEGVQSKDILHLLPNGRCLCGTERV